MLHPITIGNYRFENNLALAPMAGVTDQPFRILAKKLGAGITVSEMVASNPETRSSRKSLLRTEYQEEPSPVIVQLVGNDASVMADAAKFHVDQGAHIIDINMGCPAKKVCRKAAGSALLGDEKNVARILCAVVNAIDHPVTLKIRTGVSREARNAVQIAKIAEDNGVQLLTVHGRSREDKFNGDAEYETIRQVCQAVKLPVIANGDISSAKKAAQVFQATGAAGIMIGRGAQGRPWIFREIAHFLKTGEQLPAPKINEIATLMLEHLTNLHTFYGEPAGVRIARKHIGWYFSTLPDSQGWRKRINQLTSSNQQLDAVEQYFERILVN